MGNSQASIDEGDKNKSEIISVSKERAKDLHTELKDTSSVMKKIIESAVKLTQADFGCVYLYNEYTKRLECRYADHCQYFNQANSQGCSFEVKKNNRLFIDVFKECRGKIVDNLKRKGYTSNYAEKSQLNILSQIAVPLLENENKQQALGVLILHSMRESHFGNADLDMLNDLVGLGAPAFKNSQNSQHYKRMIDKLSLLSEASNTLLSEYENKSLDDKFDFIVEKTTEILDAELCTLWLVEDGNITIKTSFGIKSGLGEPEKIDRKKKLPIKSGPGSGLHGHIAYTKVVHNLFGEQIWNHPAITTIDTSDFLSTEISYSSLSYPLLDETGELMGLLCAYNKRDEQGKPLKDRGFSKEFDELLMKILTMKLIISIKNASLVSKLTESLNQLKNYELIIENTPDPVVITTEHGVITYMNDGALRLFGDIKGKKVADYYYSDEVSTGHEKAQEIMQKMLSSETGGIKNYDTVFTSKNGSPIPLVTSVNLLKNEKGEIIGTIGISKDLREIKTLVEVGNSLLMTHDLDAILAKISDECLKLPQSTRAYVKLYDEKIDCLSFYALSSKKPDEHLPVEATPKDRGMTGYVFMTQKPYFSGDVSQEPPERYYPLFPDVKSKIVVPINSVDKKTNQIKTLGVISIDSNELNVFSVNDTYFLSTLANQAAAAIENANLISSKTKIITELFALKKVQETITKTLDVNQILESMLDVVVNILGFDYTTISRVDFSAGKVGTVKGRNVSQEFLDMAWHSLDSNDIQAWVIRNKQEVKLVDWDERLDREIYEHFDHKDLVRIYLPILSRDESYGTLETGYNKTHRQDISEEEIEILKKIVNLVGIGIDKAYLFKEEQKLFDQLQALNQASIYMQSSRTEEEAVKHIFRSLKRIGYSQGMLSLVNETTGKIEGRYALGSNWEKIKEETKRNLKGNDILAIAIRKKDPILSKDCPSDPTCDQPAIRKADIKSQYVIPLIVDEKAIGTLQIDLSDKQGLVKGPEDVLKRRMEVLETFASQIAIAIRNVRDRKMINFLETTLTETAHEFRSPLHNILTQIGGLKDYIPEGYEKEKEIDQIFKIISEEAHRASRQMENTLLFSDRSRGLVGFNFELGFIQDVIQQCVNSYRLRALERGISIVIKDNVKNLPRFKFDKQKMEQVINNLLDNAIKYSHFNRIIQIQGFDDGTKIHIDIWDKGLGIPESEFDNIFQGFVRGSSKDKKRYIPGTGLGLKISKQIVETHGGKIKVKSTPFFNDPRRVKEYEGYDTIFTIILPKHQ